MGKANECFDFTNLEEYLKKEICPEDIECTLAEIIIFLSRHATKFDELADVEWVCNGIAEAYFAIRYIRRENPGKL